jgi:hypothetical protein
MKDRKSQKIILIISVAVIAWGIFDLATGDFADFFKVNSIYSPPSSRNMSFAVLFLLAIVMAFFSAKNLLNKE